MDVNIQKLGTVLKKRKTYLNQQYQPFGSALKQKRKLQKLTLIEACKNICSISYFSKVENNQIIPSISKKMLLQERFEIPDQFLNESMFQDEIELWIDFMLHQDKQIELQLKTISFEDNHYGWMHRFLCEVHFEDKNPALKTLFDYFDRYSDEAIFVLLHTYASLSYKLSYYQQAHDIIEILDMDVYQNEKILLLYYDMITKTSFACHKTLRFMEGAKQLESLSIKFETFDRIKQLRQMLVTYQSMYHQDTNYSHIDHSYIAHVMYMKGMPIDELLELPINEISIMIMFINNHPLMDHYIDQFNQPHHIVVRWIKTHQKKSKEDMLSFLRNEMQHEVMSKYGFETLHFIYTQSSRYFEQSNFYKEASQIYKRAYTSLTQIRIG